MKIINNKLKNNLNIRTEKDFPVEGIEFIDINPLILEKDSFKEIIDLFVEKIKNKNVDYIIAPEARGFLFGGVIADRLNIGLVPVRKKGKLPPTTIQAKIDFEKEYGKDTFELPKLVNNDFKDKRFYIIDDIYATGNTLKAIEEVITDLGGIIVGKGVIVNIVELNNDKDIFSLIDINEE